MKHTEEYLQAKYVVENPKEYDNRDVQRANSIMRAYEQALNICSVSQQRELLIATIEKVRYNLDGYGALTSSQIAERLEKAINCG